MRWLLVANLEGDIGRIYFLYFENISKINETRDKKYTLTT